MNHPDHQYVIYSESEFRSEGDGDGGFWSVADGWGPLETATRFSEEEMAVFRLPFCPALDAVWMPEGGEIHVRREEGSGGVQRLRWFAVTGRIPGTDENCTIIVPPTTRQAAMEAFTEALWRDAKSHDRQQVEAEHGVPVRFVSVLSSQTEIFYETF